MGLEWTAGVVTAADGDEPPRVDEWRPATVPGRPEAFADVDEPIAYRTQVADPRSDAAERAFLELRGIYGRARFWVDGEYRGEHEAGFVPARLEIDPRPESEVVVACSRPEAFAGIHGSDEVPDAFAVPGIRWGADLQVRPPTFIRDLAVTPHVTDEEAVIDADVTVDAGEAVDESVTLSLRPEGFRGGGSMERAGVAADAGERVTVSTSIRVRDPSLWWPRGDGPQHRYTVRAKLGDDSAERTTGLRTVERDDDGLLVNGRRVRARGFTRLPGGDPGADVARAVDANATLLRARAHVPSHAFHDACDEAGVLVWQDLPVTGPALDVERGEVLANALADAYGRHPSVALFGVQDEPEDPFESPLGSGVLDRLRLRWRIWRTDVDRGPAERVAAAFPPETPVVPVAGAPGTDPDAAHLYPGWRYLEADDVEWLLDRYPSPGTVVGGFGAGSLAAGTEPEDADAIPGIEPDVLAARGNDGAPTQAEQARVVETVAEALRRRGCGVLAAATLRDVASAGGMGVLEADGSEKPAFEAMAEAYEPVQSVLDRPPGPGSVGITLLNDTTEPVDATVAWRAGDRSGESEATAESHGRAAAGTVDVPDGAESVVLETTGSDRTVRNRYRL